MDEGDRSEAKSPERSQDHDSSTARTGNIPLRAVRKSIKIKKCAVCNLKLSYDSDSQLEDEAIGPAPEEGRHYVFSSSDTDDLLRAVRKTMMVEEEQPSVQDEMFGGLRSQQHRVFPVNQHVRAMIMEGWQESERKLVIPRDFRNRLPFEPDDIKESEDVPKIDVPVAKVARKTAIPFEDSSGLKDPMDRKADGLLNKAWEASATTIKTNIAATSVARSMSRWLDDLDTLVQERAPRDTVLESIALLKLATGFMADASAESIRFSARNEELTNSAHLAIWLKTWSGDSASKNKLCSIPFSGIRVFGPAFDDILEKASDKKGGFPKDRPRRGPPSRRFRSFRGPDYKGKGKSGRWSYYRKKLDRS
ncbi:LOW QUALITY PROTEIN: lamina-associated polypeptide 2, isoforms alpha/zeta-like [Anomaloglossus baeobatrachus]